jgi:membrane protein
VANPAIYVWGIIREAVSDWIEDKASVQGAALAFYSILSLAPLIVISLAIASVFFDANTATTQFLGQVQSMVGKEGAEAVGSMLQTSDKPETGTLAAVLGIATLLVGASGVFGQLQETMNMIWDVEPKAGGGIWDLVRRRFLSFAMVLGTGFLLLVSLVLSAGISAVSHLFAASWPEMEATVHLGNEVVTFLVMTLLFAMMFKLLPDTQVAWRDVWTGALLTAALFTVGKLLIGLYLGKSAIGSAYGAAGSLVVLVVWIYYSAQVLFLGAELAHTQAERRTRAGSEPRAASN